VIGADMNGHVGLEAGGYEGVHGGHGFGDRNEEGSNLLEMAEGLDLVVVNACFQKKEEHRITYRSGPYASQIDYLLVRQVDRKCVYYCKVIPGEAAIRQHRVLAMSMELRCKRADRRNKQKDQIRTWKLKGDNVEIFRYEVQSRMSVSQEVTWDKLKSSTMESARKVCGMTRGQKRKERETWWWAQEVQEAVNIKRKLSRTGRKIVSEPIKREVPWDMLYADDLIVAEDSPANLQTRFPSWQGALESKGLKINAGKTENMVCTKDDETLTISDSKGNVLMQVETFKYLGSVINARGGCEEDAMHRIKAAWQNMEGTIRCSV